MKLAAVGLIIYAGLTIMAGAVAYAYEGSLASVLIGTASGVVLLWGATAVRKGNYLWLYAAMGMIMFLGGFFGFQFILNGILLPSGLMLIFSFLALGVLIVDLFLTLQKE